MRKKKQKAMKVKKAKTLPVDGMSAKDKKNLRNHIRQVWSWSYAPRLVRKRCLRPDGFSDCEMCFVICPKVFVDHVRPCGKLDAGFIARCFVPSKKLQGLCDKCHRIKTKEELKARGNE